MSIFQKIKIEKNEWEKDKVHFSFLEVTSLRGRECILNNDQQAVIRMPVFDGHIHCVHWQL